jgi:CubicO group peptidase (beta-lactamase class C family)
MQIKESFFLLLLLFSLGRITLADPPSASALPRSTPEQQGISAAAILAFIEAADQIDSMHSFMLVRHGQVVAEAWWSPYGPESPHVLYSLSKSFTSTAVGLAVAEGKLSVDDQVLKFFPEDAPPEPSENLKAMRVSDLLRMSTGHHTAPSLGTDQPWTKAFLAHPVPHKPGAHFLYNTPATYMLSAIVQKVTGITVLDYLRSRLFEPLGIENPIWGTSPQGISLGGYGLSVRTEDIARFGQLYLQKGEWRGRRLVPASWIEAATALQTSNGSNPNSDWDQGYGYQFWRCRNGLYRGDGAFGQYCIVMPQQDAVVAITSGVRNMQEVLNLVYDRLLPAFEESALAPNPAAFQQLSARLGELAVRTVSGKAASPLAEEISGKRFVFGDNDRGIEAVSFEFGSDGVTVKISTSDGDNRILFGKEAWKQGSTRFVNGLDARALEPAEHRVAGSGAWTADDTYLARLCLYETPFHLTLAFRFKGDELVIDSESNVAFGPRTFPQLVGRRE